MTGKKRLDTLVLEKGFAESRERAKTLIMSGNVYVGSQKSDKPGTMLPADTAIEVRGQGLRYVNRGGLKLEKAIELYALDLPGLTCMDIGASTGGFTDRMLQNGAEKVYLVDVGYGQLVWKLHTDARVVNLERTNVRYSTSEQVPDPTDFFSVDVSSISLTLVLPVARTFLSDNVRMLCLIKPQFEAGHENAGKKGMVRGQAAHGRVIVKVRDFVPAHGFPVLGLTFSSVKGPKGDIEYLIYLQKSEHPEDANGQPASDLVEQFYIELNGGGTH